MKFIKKLSVLAVAALVSIGATQAQVGLQVGYNQSTQSTTNTVPKNMSGFHVGPTYEMEIQGPISLQYGLLYNFLTHKVSDSKKVNAHRVDIPVRVAAGFPLTSDLKAYVFGGPNFDLGIAQNGIVTDNLFDGDNFSRFDIQLGAGAGLQYNNLGLRFSYDWGMLDRNSSDLVNWKNNDLKASLIVSF